ncbi:MAG: hypothetical protein A2Y07_02895 [Planctomycetes bacterium GWF2_50_10]|nr:MAG: hypothetical protein A2Y07_02895 [Planctomycetes bacterium GWF2_50_10]
MIGRLFFSAALITAFCTTLFADPNTPADPFTGIFRGTLTYPCARQINLHASVIQDADQYRIEIAISTLTGIVPFSTVYATKKGDKLLIAGPDQNGNTFNADVNESAIIGTCKAGYFCRYKLHKFKPGPQTPEFIPEYEGRLNYADGRNVWLSATLLNLPDGRAQLDLRTHLETPLAVLTGTKQKNVFLFDQVIDAVTWTASADQTSIAGTLKGTEQYATYMLRSVKPAAPADPVPTKSCAP